MSDKNPPFRFKQFSVHQDQCAMKVGTDGVLLGAWAEVEHRPNAVLDIGSGTGLIALMLAQRSQAELIDAVEVDEKAYEQCVENFENSSWGDRLFCYHAAFDEFVTEMQGETYDLILSNPPFFRPSKSGETLSKQRQTARFNNNLPFKDLIEGAAALLSHTGRFCVVIPEQNRSEFTEMASAESLSLQKMTKVKGRPEAPVKRVLLQFGFEKTALQTDELVIETERHHYTPAYIALTRAFYLKIP